MCAEVTAAASLSMRIGVGHKKGFGSHDGITPYHEVRIKRTVSDDLTDEEMVEKAEEIHKLCRKLVEKKIADDRADLQKVD